MTCPFHSWQLLEQAVLLMINTKGQRRCEGIEGQKRESSRQCSEYGVDVMSGHAMLCTELIQGFEDCPLGCDRSNVSLAAKA